MPDLGGRILPVVVAAVGVAHGGIGEGGGIHIVEAGDVHGVEVATQDVEVAAAESVHAAMAAEQVVHAVAAELVVGERVLAGQQAESLGLGDHAPIAGLGADRAVALAGARAEVDVGLVADFSAVAAAMVGLDAHGSGSVLRDVFVS